MGGAAIDEVDLPHSAMHLMGSVRIVDRDLAFVRSGLTPWTAIETLKTLGFDVLLFPDEELFKPPQPPLRTPPC